MQEIFNAADADALWALSSACKSFQEAARPRLLPAEHFGLGALYVPASTHRNMSAPYLFDLNNDAADVHLRADVMSLFAWDWWREEAAPSSNSRQGTHFSTLHPVGNDIPWAFDFRGAASHTRSKGDGRINRIKDIPAKDRLALVRARVLDVDYPLDKAALALIARLMPRLHTYRFLPGANTLLQEGLPYVERVVFFDAPARWTRPFRSIRRVSDIEVRRDLCSPITRKVVIHQRGGHAFECQDVSVLSSLPNRPEQLEHITYVFHHWELWSEERERNRRWALKGGYNPGHSLAFFVKVAVWAAGHGIKVTVVGAQDLNPQVLPGFRATEGTGHDRQADVGLPGSSDQQKLAEKEHSKKPHPIVEALKRELARYAKSVKEETVEGKPMEPLVTRVIQNVVFLTRDAYRDKVGQVDFEIETDVYYYTRPRTTTF